MAGSDSKDANERQALLSRVDDDYVCPSKSSQPLPYAQLTLLTIWRSAHPICFCFIFPWIAQNLVELGIATQKNVGYYAGLVETSYSLALLVGLMPAVLASDTFGRKPTVLVGLLFASVASAFFAFAKTLHHLIIIRALVGFSVAFIPASVMTMFIELSTRETQPLYFALSSLGYQIGAMTAPFIGGALAKPAETWPGRFNGFWKSFPYALPSLVVACFVASTAILGIFIAQETLAKEKRPSVISHFSCLRRRNKQEEGHAPLLGMFTWSTSYMLMLWFLMVFVAFLNYSCEVLFFYTPRHLGGLGLTSKESAVIWFIRPAVTTAFELTFYPAMERRWGPEKVLKICTAGFPLTYLMRLGLAYLAGEGLSSKGVYACLAIIMVWCSLVNPAYLACGQVLACRAPSREYLTRINTASEFAANGGHGFGALVGSNIFKYCVENKILNRNGMWLAHIAMATVLAMMTQLVTHKKGWREIEEEAEEEATQYSE